MGAWKGGAEWAVREGVAKPKRSGRCLLKDSLVFFQEQHIQERVPDLSPLELEGQDAPACFQPHAW